MNKQDKEIEELLQLIQEQADDWLEENSYGDEFEDIEGDPIRTFRTEYQHEQLTCAGHTRYKKWSGQ